MNMERMRVERPRFRLPERELMGSGHLACPGCGAALAMRYVLKALGERTVVVLPACCWTIIAGPFPYSTLRVPLLHTAFETAAVAAAGVRAALDLQGDTDTTVLAWAGDGGTFDIGLQALSGAAERNENILYVCYDNEAYMNTGIQRSGATPPFARTTTTPVGAESPGKPQRRKDLTEIVAAHRIPYVAQAAISDWQDLTAKVQRALRAEGPSFLNVLSTCTLGWDFPPDQAIRMAHLAVQTCYWPLYEVVEGVWRLTYEPEPRTPEERAKWGRYGLDIAEWLKQQGRFAHLFQQEDGELVVKPACRELVAELQRQVERDWEQLLVKCGRLAGAKA